MTDGHAAFLLSTHKVYDGKYAEAGVSEHGKESGIFIEGKVVHHRYIYLLIQKRGKRYPVGRGGVVRLNFMKYICLC